MINKVTLVGRLGQDADTRNFDNGSVTRFSLATNESYTNKDGKKETKTEWHNIVGWNNLSKRCSSLKKGENVYLEGKIQTRSWKDKSGNTRNTTEIVVSKVEFLNNKSAGSKNSSPSISKKTGKEYVSKDSYLYSDLSFNSDEIPF